MGVVDGTFASNNLREYQGEFQLILSPSAKIVESTRGQLVKITFLLGLGKFFSAPSARNIKAISWNSHDTMELRRLATDRCPVWSHDFEF
jgi:hypothetical protein